VRATATVCSCVTASSTSRRSSASPPAPSWAETRLPGGTIRLHGVIRNGSQSYAVVGGTGRYAHARGTITIGSGKSPLNTYHLKLGGLTAIMPVI
jgi:hypothetical protein